MKMFRASGLLALGLAFSLGCNQAGNPTQSAEQLAGRLEAARGVNNPTTRDDALKAVAKDAARSGVEDVTLQAVLNINNPTARDETAATCALILVKRGDTKAAKVVAEKINQPTLRDKTLKEIATSG